MYRVLLAGRGELTRRLIRAFADRDIETCAVFSEPEVEAPWVDEADYAVYLNGATVEDTYLHAQRLISAAHDAGATVIHPGYCFLAERPDFIAAANAANLRVIAPERSALERIADRFTVRRVAHQLGVPVLPASKPLPDGEDGLEIAAALGLPLYVKAVAGGVVLRVDAYEQLPAAVREARRRAALVTGSPAVFLSARVPDVRQIGTTVVREGGDRAYVLGHHDKSVQVRFRTWLEELGPEVVPPELAARMSRDARRLVEALQIDGVVRVRWAVNHEGGYWLLGVSGRLTTGYTLTEAVYGIDLVDTQIRLSLGEPLGWEGADTTPPMWGVQLRLLHVDPADGVSRPPGVLERLELPDDVATSVGVGEGQECTEETEPLLALITVTGPTRQATLVKARAALERVVIEGVANNLDVLKRLFGEPEFWAGRYDVHLVDRLLGVDGPAATP
jgi:acetyl/propionyl-CoA carboxylase alpha subunit